MVHDSGAKDAEVDPASVGVSHDIAAELASLDSNPAPAAVRFDSAAPFTGVLVVLPSAFNPPTIAHRHLLEVASGPTQGAAPLSGRLPSAKVAPQAVALLTTKNVDKGLHGASLTHRVRMLLAMREDSPGIAVAASNQARIIDQAEALTSSFPGIESLTFVVGFDTLERLFAPRYYTDMERELLPFFERHSVLAANRGAVSTAQVREWIAANTGSFAGRVAALEIDEVPAALSSTQVRDALAESDDHPALSPAVRAHILNHNLYRS